MGRAEAVDSFIREVCDLDLPTTDGEHCVCVEIDDLREIAGRYLSNRSHHDLPQVVADVLMEVERAIAKFPTWPVDPIHACQVFNEEGGELTKAVLQQMYEPEKNPPGAVRKEALQAAAMALRFLAGMDAYDWTRGKQVEQRSLAAGHEAHSAERAAVPDDAIRQALLTHVPRITGRKVDAVIAYVTKLSAAPTLAGKEKAE